MAIALRYAARSDVGLVRSNNQDSAYAGPYLVVVADGMGGHAGGDIASSLAIGQVATVDGDSHGGDALDVLAQSIYAAEDDIRDRAQQEPELSGMGTTVTALLRSGNRLALAHIGDSRAYLLRENTLTQVTIDHTYVQHLVDLGQITPEEAERHPQRSVVMRVLCDIDTEIELDLSWREAKPGDRWLLCSDGLSGVVSKDTIEETMVQLTDTDECADALVALALRGGAPDNVTCIIADVVDLNTLGDGQAPSTVPQVVGSAAISRNTPTRAVDGPAARAAALSKAATTSADDAAGLGADGSPVEAKTTRTSDEEDDDLNPKRPRWQRVTTWVLLAVAVLIVLGGALFAAYRWTQTQYFVGVASSPSGDVVVVYQGIPQTFLGIDLSSPVDSSGEKTVKLNSLPDYVQTRVRQTIPADNPAAGWTLIEALPREGQDSGATATAEPSNTAQPSPSPTTTPSPSSAEQEFTAPPVAEPAAGSTGSA